jgi:hypothetical protein
LLEKDELMQNLWADRFVEEGSLAFHQGAAAHTTTPSGRDYRDAAPPLSLIAKSNRSSSQCRQRTAELAPKPQRKFLLGSSGRLNSARWRGDVGNWRYGKGMRRQGRSARFFQRPRSL